MDGMDPISEQRYMPRTGAMFSRGSLAKADMATDLAIPIVAEGGWPALTLRNVARAANVTPQAIAAWFPSVAAMRIAVASRYGDRWIRHRSRLAGVWTRSTGADDNGASVSDVVVAMLPQSWVEEVYDGIWLTILEASRWDEAIGSVVTTIHERERDVVRDLVDPSGRLTDEELEREVELVLALVRGLRAVG